MPRYHFNLHDGVSQPDPDGTELPDLDAAREGAVRLVGELLQDGYKGIMPGDDWRLEVTDESGLILFRLDFTMMAAACVSGAKPGKS